jgi:hypothetical protein
MVKLKLNPLLGKVSGGFRQNAYPNIKDGGQQIFFSKNKHGLMLCDNTKNRNLKQLYNKKK